MPRIPDTTSQAQGVYPQTHTEVLDPPVDFKDDTLEVVRCFKNRGPWKGSFQERKANYRQLHESLNIIYGKTTKLVFHKDLRKSGASGASGSSNYNRGTDTITLNGKLSVITYLHEYRHAMGGNEFAAVRWSLNLFRAVFPEQFARLGFNGHMAG